MICYCALFHQLSSCGLPSTILSSSWGQSDKKTNISAFYEFFLKIHHQSRGKRQMIARITVFIYFSCQWLLFQLYATIITNFNIQKKKGLQALITNFTCISYGNDSGRRGFCRIDKMSQKSLQKCIQQFPKFHVDRICGVEEHKGQRDRHTFIFIYLDVMENMQPFSSPLLRTFP
jgi:hypothetical protein